MVNEVKKGGQKTRIGEVVGAKMDKSAVVKVERRVKHPVFKKIVTRSKRYHVHDEKNELKVGDRVKIIESRPLSKLKRWRLAEVLVKAEQ